jgi:hypothetical protein
MLRLFLLASIVNACLCIVLCLFVNKCFAKVKKSYFSPGAAFDLYVTAPENDGSGLQYERTICRGVCISQNAQME